MMGATLKEKSLAKIYRRIYQTYVGAKKNDLAAVRFVYRPLSLPLTVPPLLLGITPNQATVLNFFLACSSSLAFCYGSVLSVWIGAGLFFATFVGDCIDGNLARYLNQRRYYGKLIDGLVDVFVYTVYIAIAVSCVRSGGKGYSKIVVLLSGCSIALAATFVAYFRMRLTQFLNEVRKEGAGSGEVATKAREGSLKKRLILGARALFENLGPIGPLLLIGALLMDLVAEFIMFYAITYVAFAVAEIIYGLRHYQKVLNVPRPSK